MDMVTIRHPRGMAAEVPASAVRHWERAGWTTKTAGVEPAGPAPAVGAAETERPRRRSDKSKES